MQERLNSLRQIYFVEHKDVAACLILGWEEEQDSTFHIQGWKKLDKCNTSVS